MQNKIMNILQTFILHKITSTLKKANLNCISDVQRVEQIPVIVCFVHVVITVNIY